jgi:hypothetical protein
VDERRQPVWRVGRFDDDRVGRALDDAGGELLDDRVDLTAPGLRHMDLHERGHALDDVSVCHVLDLQDFDETVELLHDMLGILDIDDDR